MNPKQALLHRAEQQLTNYFTGKTPTTMNFNDKLQVTLENKSTTLNATIALATGGIPTDAIVIDGTNAYQHHHDTSRMLQAGYGVDVILDDMTPKEVNDGGIDVSGGKFVMAPADNTFSIRHAISHLKDNPRYIKTITIQTENKAVYSSGSIEICSVSPFHREAERSFNLGDYYSVNQYQSDKIIIPFAADQLQWNDLLYMALTGIPSETRLVVIVEFF